MASPSPEPAAAAAAAVAETNDPVHIRRLELADHERGFVALLSQLSTCPDLTASEFAARFAELAAQGDDHVILVAEDHSSAATERRILATGCLFVERKFLRGGGKVGHVEDVVVDAAARGRELGLRVVRRLVENAREAGCYKVILDCTPELCAYYAKCGFVEKGVQMAVYF
ncbi:probable glucosamine 6-phosphate N-acetyltransferase 2 [Phragmites australis]|uniref:probable glucosamine 6-phosphate N-acetyltransferase 2 n=1 Tax=Phragmites australis TaxID=29695 RepID=UPI002D76B304|nr:probable glucosamine 6-phosphate N-acetyltransferase 2 [Phragmites australis]XP_062220125.1 probable glucosamine 6-phosphate N-acetyltransferase 2 [Phragmites australis]XP_062220126.1 probable glucosamine 6-phosphate N-acetyltransferase 2 [Phragmites australis]XP_062220127.1 probable glucosamine 6-phosphate N-acetyltransferase 2 [Phragmites australis]XP_062220128.1 probable glucosamine 6-phosphate N-acetyltransferase 2 [Phragmites australis]XP_062220129.1 probable glucosamine 6-phosphate N-